VIRLTKRTHASYVNYMSRLIFAALASISIAGAAEAQQVPGRDLLEFPLGLLADAPALSTQMTGGLWNPAATMLGASRRSAIGIAGLTTPQDQGVRLDMIGGAYRIRPTVVASLSFAQASVADILRTESDPMSRGNEIAYGTMLLSAGTAVKRKDVSLGLMGRYRWGSFDTDRAGTFALDAGAILDHVAHTPVRVAVSTFLFSPSSHSQEATYLAAADVPLVRRDTTFLIRAGYSLSQTEGRGREDYAFGTSVFHQVDLSGGIAQTSIYGHSSHRLRLGFGVRSAGYHIAIGREDGATGFGASYQFLFTRVFP
jgi:hypothetical protein